MSCNLLSFCRFLILTASLLLAGAEASGQIVDFEDLTPTTPYSGPGGGYYWDGSDKAVPGQYDPSHWMGPNTAYNSSFSDDGVALSNLYTEWWTATGDLWYTSWTGWAYSNTTDDQTPGFGNQYSAYPGAGAAGSQNYAVYYGDFDTPTVTVSGIPSGTLQGAYFTNTTYAALAMLDGDAFAAPFGEDDWFKLTVNGLDDNDQQTGTVDFFLADYTAADESLWHVVDDWTWVDLSSLGNASRLQFELDSSDWTMMNGFPVFMNTPAYFAMDNLTLGVIPEPSTLLLLLCGGAAGAAVFGRRRKRCGA